MFLKSSVAAALVASLLCSSLAVAADRPASPKALTLDQKILHILNRTSFGVRSGDVERVKAIGIKKYLEQQLDPLSINDQAMESRIRQLEVMNLSTAELFAKYPNPATLIRAVEGNQTANADPGEMNNSQRQERQRKLRELYQKYDLRPANQIMPQVVTNRVLRAVYSERQLQEVMVDFWQNHFNVFSGKAAVRWYIPSYERDVLRKNALGNFKGLVVGTAKHPAMLFYLDNFQSVSPSAQMQGRGRNAERLQQMARNGRLPAQARERLKRQTGLNDAELDQRIKEMQANPQPPRQQRGINENYARELMELHTLGVDGGYTQNDIVEVAKCFTGWTIADPRGDRRSAAATVNGTGERRARQLQRLAGAPEDIESGEFYFNPRWHASGSKTVLGKKIDDGGIKDGLKVIDILVEHPSTARFIARKLAVKFVNDKPSEGLVTRVAEAFKNSKGDIKTTLRALFEDKEFFAPEVYRAKIKTPFELAISSFRALGSETSGGPAMMGMLSKLGEIPYGYQAPTGYPDTAEDWVNAGALLERLNFAIALASNRIPGTRVNLSGYDATSKQRILDRAITEILEGEVSSGTRALLQKQIDQPLPEVTEPAAVEPETMQGNMRGVPPLRLLRPTGDPNVFKVVSLVLGTPEFQRQ